MLLRRTLGGAFLLCAVALYGLSAGAIDVKQELIAQGAQLALAKCGQCHAVGLSDEAAHPITPPFRELYEDFPIPMLADALATGVISGHDEMPMFEFTHEDARALLAYIDSLQPDKPSYLRQFSATAAPKK